MLSYFRRRLNRLFANVSCVLEAAVVDERQSDVQQNLIRQGHAAVDSDNSKLIYEVQEVERAIARATMSLERTFPDQLKLVMILLMNRILYIVSRHFDFYCEYLEGFFCFSNKCSVLYRLLNSAYL